MNDALISKDRMKYEKNKISSTLVYVAIVFNALFFMSVYRGVFANIGNYYFTITMGVSVLLNLIFMLFAFLSSEGVKNYKIFFAVLLIVLAGLQIVRIFVFPLGAHSTPLEKDPSKVVMETPQFIRCIVYLIGSATCLAVAGVVGIIKTWQLSDHKAKHPEVFVDFGVEEAPVADANAEDVAGSPAVFSQEPMNTSDDNE